MNKGTALENKILTRRWDECSGNTVGYQGHLKESCLWTLSIVQCFFKKQRFGNWICFRLQVKRKKGGGPYSVEPLRKS
jgi:hypothetical protein